MAEAKPINEDRWRQYQNGEISGSEFYYGELNRTTRTSNLQNTTNSAQQANSQAGVGSGFNPYTAGFSFLGDLYGSYQDRQAQKEANATNERIAKENREFQERMSNSAHQRAALDMESAGLNRILAAGSPASSPSGSTTSVAPLPNSGISRAATAALSHAQQAAAVRETQARTANTAMDTYIKQKEIPGSEIKNDIMSTIKETFGNLKQAAKDRWEQLSEGKGFVKPKETKRTPTNQKGISNVN